MKWKQYSPLLPLPASKLQNFDVKLFQCKVMHYFSDRSLLKREISILMHTDTPAFLQVTLKLAADYY